MAANNDKPILIVEARDSDLQQRVIGGFGEPKEIVEVTKPLRAALKSQLERVSAQVASAIRVHPRIPAVIRLHLRQEALAKTHRPMDLLERAGMRPIGTRRFGELLLPATLDSITNLARIITSSEAKKIKANISTIESFNAYSQDDVLQKDRYQNFEEVIAPWIASGKPMVLERFTNNDSETDAAIAEHLESVLTATRSKTLYQEHKGRLRTVSLVQIPSMDAMLEISASPGVRLIQPAQEFAAIKIAPQWFNEIGKTPPGILPMPTEDLPIVAVVDTGIVPNDKLLKDWVVDREPYLLPPETDYLHGTFVAGLVAGSRSLNGGHLDFPDSSARVLDIAALGTTGNTSLDDMLERIKESVQAYPHVKVWNCSFGTPTPGNPDDFGILAQELDQLADQHDVLFVIAAGNYSEPPLRTWPSPPNLAGKDRISEPAEAVRALTVGSVAHIDALVADGDPSPFSRRGPGPAKTPKPDITHLGGNCDQNGAFGGAGVISVLPGGRIGESIGTSFATPLASALAANVWATLDQARSPVRAEIVKALMIHAAAVSSPKRTPDERNYHGFGVPQSVLETLFCSPDTFTLMFDAELFDGQIWEKTPFPIPACLHPNGTHFKGEIILTLVYSPPVDGQHGSEYVRANVNAHFGSYDPDSDGELKHRGMLPLDSPDKSDLYEEAMIDHGYKWSPVKVYRAPFRRGKAGRNFRLYLELLRRAGEPSRQDAQRAVVLITMRGLDGEKNVYTDGLKAANQLNWITNRINGDTRVRT